MAAFQQSSRHSERPSRLSNLHRNVHRLSSSHISIPSGSLQTRRTSQLAAQHRQRSQRVRFALGGTTPL